MCCLEYCVISRVFTRSFVGAVTGNSAHLEVMVQKDDDAPAVINVYLSQSDKDTMWLIDKLVVN